MPILLMIVVGSVVILPDVLTGGRRSQETRYLLPFLLAVQICVAAFLSAAVKPGAYWMPIGRFLAILVFIAGLLSQMVVLSSDSWWNKSVSARKNEIAAMINAQEKPILITMLGEINPGEILSMSYLLKDDVRLWLFSEPVPPVIPKDTGRVFVLNPPWAIQEMLEKKFKMTVIDEKDNLWEINQ